MLTPQEELEFCKLRRKAISLDYPNLNPEQLEGVLSTDGPLLLLAGAGSGKTTVLIHRVANLIRYGCGSDSSEVPEWVTSEDLSFLRDYIKNPDSSQKSRQEYLCALDPAVPWSIIAITFTNKAAGEMKDRLSNLLGPSANDLWASTFHSACVRILRRDIEKLGFSSSFTIYDSDDSVRVIKDVMRELEISDKDFPPRMVLNHISRAKDAMQLASEYAKNNAGDYRLSKIAQIYTEYEKRLWAASALDFDDIILHTVRLLEKDEQTRDYYQDKFRYVLIDEYQDTNPLQYKLAALLAGKWENICVVGDDDQSIYRFRGATIENILSFETQYKGARVIRLEQNYRSTGNILHAANAVIRNNQGRKGKELWTKHQSGEKLQFYSAQNEHDEAQYIVTQILAGLKENRKEKDFAILYRNNNSANIVYQTLIRNGIEVHMRHPMTASAEIRDIMAYLYIVLNSDDDLRLRRIINVPARGIGERTVDMLEELAAQRGVSIFSVLNSPELPDELGRASGKLVLFRNMIADLKEKATILNLPTFYDYLMAASGYMKFLEEKKTPENQRRIDRLMEFKSIIQDYIQRAEENGSEPTLSGFLEDMALDEQLGDQDDEEGNQRKPKEERVQMMTMHGAKGLEFPVVFLIAMEDSVFPGQRSIGDQESMEEERRLCYVAMTRAKEVLHISSAATRMLYGRTNTDRPSRFLREIPEDLIESSGKGRSGWSAAESSDVPREPSYERSYQRRPSAPAARPSGNGGGNSGAASRPVRQAPRPTAPVRPAKAASVLLPEYHKGDMVHHKAFGRGMVLSLQKTGGDALIEIAFDQVGTKRLMLKFASQFMTKES